MSDLAAARARYVELIAKRERISSPRLLEALATVPREEFLAKGPWRIKSEAAGIDDTASQDAWHADQVHPERWRTAPELAAS